MNRRERRAEARKSKELFEPHYNGQNPKTYEEAFGVGYERFNNKWVAIRELKVEEVTTEETTS